MILALPLQTFASAALMGCEFTAHLNAGQQGAMADANMAGCHDQEQPDTPPTQHNCKHCTACALASTLPVPVTATLAFEPVPDSFSAQPAASFSGFIPDGPERPPRTFLA